MRTRGAAIPVAVAAFVVSFMVICANGRAIGSGDTNAMERTAGALAEHGTVILPGGGGLDPFTRAVQGGRVSIYPVLPALLAAPLFFVCGLFFDLSPAGLQIAGKLSAALVASLAVALLARAFARRTSSLLALVSALLFALGTSAYSTAQALWQHPFVLLFLVIAMDALDRLETASYSDQPSAPAAALALSLAAACRPAVIPMCAVLFIHLLIRARGRAGSLIAIAGIPAGFVSLYNATLFGAPWNFGPAALGDRFFTALPESAAGLLFSPARGLVVFTPIALIALWGLVSTGRCSSTARGLMAATAVHFTFIACWNEWHGGESFGPRLLTDLLPALFFYLPEGLAAWPKAGAALGIASIGIQLLGGWTYDYRWERLHQRGRDFDSALWSWSDSPISFAIHEGVLIQGAPELEGRRARVRLHRSVPFGPEGSTIEGTPSGLRISGPPVIRDVRLERGARMDGAWISLAHPADVLAFRIEASGTWSVRLTGSLQGLLRVDTRLGSTSMPSSGDFDLRIPLGLEPGDEALVRAETGELRLARVEVEKN